MFKKLGNLSAVALLFMSTPGLAEDYKVVIDRNGNPVRSKLAGSCVLTQWQTADNICKIEPRRVAVFTAPNFTEEERSVYFEFDKHNLTPNAQMKLRDLARKIKNTDQVYDGRIVGYADEIGNTAYNQELSRKRANAVRHYLGQQGFVASAIDIRARGENQPVTSCDDNLPWSTRLNCLSEDRRAEVELQLKDNQQVTRVW